MPIWGDEDEPVTNDDIAACRALLFITVVLIAFVAGFLLGSWR